MAMDAAEIERLIKASSPTPWSRSAISPATATTMPPTSSAPQFKGKTRVQQHQMVYEALGGRMGGGAARPGPHHGCPPERAVDSRGSADSCRRRS